MDGRSIAVREIVGSIPIRTFMVAPVCPDSRLIRVMRVFDSLRDYHLYTLGSELPRWESSLENCDREVKRVRLPSLLLFVLFLGFLALGGKRWFTRSELGHHYDD